MVISDEIRFPRTQPVKSLARKRKVEAVDATTPVARLGSFKQSWQRQRQEDKPPSRRQLDDDELKEVFGLVRQANQCFDKNDIKLHLMLTQTDEGWLIDVYDCTSNDICEIAGDIHINLDELPILLRNLETESGLLVDTVT